MKLSEAYQKVRKRSTDICANLETEDYVVQPIVDVSPPKWHLGHTTWFWEAFVLKQYDPDYKEFNRNYNYVFNSYYEAAGARVIRTDRGNLSRPSVADIYKYREYVDVAMEKFLEQDMGDELSSLILLGLNHEEQAPGIVVHGHKIHPRKQSIVSCIVNRGKNKFYQTEKRMDKHR
jgi:hypothetical protein